MSVAFTALWTQDVCRPLRKGFVGRRPPVVFSGAHGSSIGWGSVDTGDEVFALHVNKCVIHVVSRLRVLDWKQSACCGALPAFWADPAYQGHPGWDDALGAGRCGAAPVHVDATPIRFDVTVPGELLPTLTWRNAKGVTRTPKHVVDGRLTNSMSIQGVYRLTEGSAADLSALIDAAPPLPAVGGEARAVA
ncbi:hypothetical protein [Actinoplanes palleronii]|uniref:Uncharacterized protein n=1 Tax=Actinoplanes palleronii TaxID=113570 RepID=A0ABQ4BS77_9ACTN|nr:hypothetical protein [Actinoplanes palleronii]GIE73517.1 hypothetical protein Apa02nite_096250 [Actinoplanes palleronii]